MTFTAGLLCGIIGTLLALAVFILLIVVMIKPLWRGLETGIQTKMMMLSAVMGMWNICKDIKWDTDEGDQEPDLSWIKTYCLQQLEKAGHEIANLRAQEKRK